MYQKSVNDVLAELNTHPFGLTELETEKRRAKYGYNVLKVAQMVNPWKIFLAQFSSPLIWLLLFAVAVSSYLGEWVDAAVIGIIIIINSILGFIQEYRAEKALEALEKMSALKTKVIRDGKQILVDSKEIYPGDIIVLETGDKISADARIIEEVELETDESTLTGESHTIKKQIEALPDRTQLADRSNMVYSGTIITNGRGKAVVIATGMDTEIGRIATLIKEAHETQTPLQRKLKTLGLYLTIGVVIVAIAVLVSGLFRGGDFSLILLTAIALAVAAIPEGLPAVITIALSLGVKRMVKRNVIVRKLPSVEALGSVNVICTDKTGTLTKNQMTVTKIWANNKLYEVSGSGYEKRGRFTHDEKELSHHELEPIHKLLQCGSLCNNAEINFETGAVIGDPTEAALIVSSYKSGLNHEEITKIKRIDEITFTSARKMMTAIYENGKSNISYTKGAPDIILKYCDKILIDGKVQHLDSARKKEILEENEKFARQALRVLGFAYNDVFSTRENSERSMVFLGLQAMIDPPREEAKQSVQRCHDAGIKVIMITGDHLTTAVAVGELIGIKGRAVEGAHLAEMELDKEVDEIGIYARVNPEHKIQIVTALKNKGYIVAMTGDGVNDAPAIKKADIGISMGITGTDVAKEASDMILVDDNFTSIVNAIEEGRGIFDNIRKFVNYLLSSNLGEVTAIFTASLLGLALPLTAIQILWINLITDGLPATALSLDEYSKEIMKRPPRSSKESIISPSLLKKIVLFGILIGLGTLLLFWLYSGSGEAKARTMAFTSLVVFEIVRLNHVRAEYKLKAFSNKWLNLAILSSLILQLAVIYTPLNRVFGTTPIEWMDWIVIIVVAVGLVIVYKTLWWIINKVPELFRLLTKRLESKNKQKENNPNIS